MRATQGLTSCFANSVLSPLGWGRSMAKTTQLAMMVRRTVYSKGGHSMRNTVKRRMRLLSLRMKREVGPSFFSSGSFFRPILQRQVVLVTTYLTWYIVNTLFYYDTLTWRGNMNTWCGPLLPNIQSLTLTNTWHNAARENVMAVRGTHSNALWSRCCLPGLSLAV